MTRFDILSDGQYRPEASQEIRVLTSIRMVAALLVFLEHFCGIAYGTVGKDVWQMVAIEGHIGVTIFFVLSGFLLTFRYYDVYLDGKLSLYDYIIKRVARIYPLYYALLIATFFIDIRPLFTSQSVVNWTLTQGFFSGLRYSGIPTAWSLTTEESFYLLLPVVLLSIARFLPANMRNTPRRELIRLASLLAIWTLALTVFGLAFIVVSQHTGLSVQAGFMDDIRVAMYTTIFFRFFAFAIGILSARVYQLVLVDWWKRGYGRVLAYSLLVLSTSSLVLFACQMNLAGGIYRDGSGYNYLVAISSGILILSLTNERTFISQIMSQPFFVYLGRISYALYLVQLTSLSSKTIRVIKDLAGVSGLIVDYLTVSFISAILYELVEKPGAKAVRWCSRKIRKLTSGQQVKLA